jgi:hypothetical protein
MSVDFRYKPGAMAEDLEVGEATVRRASKGGSGPAWWELWLHVERDDHTGDEYVAVAVAPSGGFTETGPGGRTWGMSRSAPGTWAVMPSINVLSDVDATRVHPGPHPSLPSIWHEYATLVGVPEGEPWQA